MIKKLANIFHSHSILIKRFITGRKKRIFFTPVRIALGILGVVIGSVLVYFFLLHGNDASASWWNDGWKYRKSVTISNTSTALTDYQAMITLDTATLITAGKMQSDCDDVRIVGQSGEQYNYWIEPTTCNTSATKIWTKVKSIPSTGGVVYIYYGNTGASSVAKSPSEIFIQEIDNVGAAWLLDESSANSCTGGVNDSCDSSTSNFDLAWGTATTSTTGKISNGLNFDGTDNATANIDNNFTPVSSSKRWTVSMWFKTSDTQGYLFDSGDSANSGDRVAVFTDGANNLSLYMASNTTGTEYKYLNYSVTSTDNNWHHLVVTRDGDNSVKLYVDGSVISVSSTTTDVDMSAYSEAWTDFHLGHRYFLNIYNYTGVIDEARVYTDSLTTTEIAALYGDGANRHGYVTANYANKELVRQYSSNVSVGSPASEEIGPGPSGYWKFDEGYGTTVNDSSGDNHTGNLGTGSSAPTWKSEESCVNGNCFQFDGTDDSINFGDVLDFTGNTEMTVSAWIRLTSAPSSRGQIISKYDAGTSGQWYFGVDGQKKVVFLRECGSYGITGNNALSLSTWNHVSGVYDGTNLKIYVNGILDETAVDSCSISNTSVDTVIGAGDNGTGTEDHFPGFIDEVKVYPYARSADEIKQDYLFSSAQGSSVVLGAQDTSFLSNGLVGYWKMDENTGTSIVDKSGNSGTGTLGSGSSAPTWSAGKYGSSLDFDGSDDYVSVPTNSAITLSGSFTLASWVKLDSLTGNNYIVEKIADVRQNYYLLEGNGTLNCGFRDASNTSWLTHTASWVPTTGQWYHVACSFDTAANTIKLFSNGTELYSATETNEPLSSTPGNLHIGTTGSIDQFMNGSLDDLRIYNRALSTSEVKELYKWAPGPIGYWNFDEGTGTSLYDKSSNGSTGTLGGDGSGSDLPLWTDGKYGSALDFENDDYVDAGSSSIYNLTDNFTVSAWILVDNTANNQGAVAHYNSGHTGGYGLRMDIGNNGKFGFVTSSGGVLHPIYADSSYSLNTWYHVTGVIRNGTKYLYVNGIQQTDTDTNLPASQASNLVFGRYYSNLSGYGAYGNIDEVRIYNYARSTSQIIEDMNAGHPAVGTPVGSTVLHLRMDEGYGTTVNDSSLQGNNGTLGTGSSAPSWTNDGKFGKALSLDGGDYISLTGSDSTYSPGTGTYSVSSWFKTSSATTQTIYNNGTGSTHLVQLVVLNTGQIQISFRDGEGDLITPNGGSVIDGAWHHAVGIRTSQTEGEIWLDGVRVGTDSDGALGDIDLSTSTHNIGRFHTGIQYFNGSIDEVKVYPFALTAEQVKLDYHGGKMMVLGAQNTDVGGTSPSNSAGREYCVPGDTTSCAAPFGEWLFNEGVGSTAYDTSGNGYNGTLGSDITTNDWSSGKVGRGINFSGNSTNDVVVVNNGASVRNKSQISLEMWIKPTVVGTYSRAMYGETINGSGSNRFSFYVTSGGALSLGGRTWDGGTFNTWVSTSNGLIAADNWYHVVGVFNSDSNLHKIYINGQLSNSNSADYSAFVDTAPQSGPHIGGQGFLSTNEMFRGTIDQVRIYDYERTAAQIAWNYNKGAPRAHYRLDECQGTTAYDASGNGLNGTITIGGSGEDTLGTCATSSTAWGSGASGKLNSSLSFDGTDDYAEVSDNTLLDFGNTADFSITGWFKRSTSTSGDVILAKRNGILAADSGYMVYVDATTDKVTFEVSDGTDEYKIESDSTIIDTNWYHMTFVFDEDSASNSKVYINGKNETGTSTGTLANIGDLSNTLHMRMGSESDGGAPFIGQLDDIRIYNYALTAHQVKEIYGGGAVVFK